MDAHTDQNAPAARADTGGSTHHNAPPATGGQAGRGADEQVRAIARAVDRNARKTTELNEQVRRLGEDVARLVTLVTTPPLIPAPVAPVEHPGGDPDRAQPDDTGPESGPPAVRAWLLSTDPGQAAKDLPELIVWLDRVYLRYPGAELSACWLWHPHVIEELWWLRRAHADAYHPRDGSWLRVGDWHDRQRPAVTKRVRDAVGNCDLSLHAANKPHGQPAAAAPLAAHAAAIAAAWATGQTRPEPTDEQLAEGAAHFTALYRSTR